MNQRTGRATLIVVLTITGFVMLFVLAYVLEENDHLRQQAQYQSSVSEQPSALSQILLGVLTAVGEGIQRAGDESQRQQQASQQPMASSPNQQLQKPVPPPRENANCRRSQMGQLVCSEVYTLDARFLTHVDKAWTEVLDCVEKFNPSYNATPLPPPEVHIVNRTGLISQCGANAAGCYLPSLKKVVIMPEAFDSIYMEYGHHVDYLAGLVNATHSHSWESYSIQCTKDPRSHWARQSTEARHSSH